MKRESVYCYEPSAPRRPSRIAENMIAIGLLVFGGVALLFLLVCISALITP